MAETLSFYDVRNKRKFTTDKYRIVTKSGRRFAVAKGPQSGGDCWRIVGK